MNYGAVRDSRIIKYVEQRRYSGELSPMVLGPLTCAKFTVGSRLLCHRQQSRRLGVGLADAPLLSRLTFYANLFTTI